MDKLPVVTTGQRDDLAAVPAERLRGSLAQHEDHVQLRSRLLQMILQNEERRRNPPSTNKVELHR